MPVVLCGLLVCVTFCLCCLRFNDPDTWWHLKLGQEIWETHSIPQADHWSFTVYGHRWIPHEWLSQLFIYAVYRLFGFTGMQLWLCLMASAIVAASYLLCYRYSRDATASALGGFLAFFFGTIGFSIRPQMIGYLLLTVELLLLLRAFRGRPRALWWLPPLFLLWVNCHASYPLGLGIFAVAVVCRSWHRDAQGLPGVRLLVTTFVLACSALLCNPLGWRMLVYPFDTFLHQHDNLAFVPEWLPPSPHEARGLAFVLVLAAMGVAGLTRGAQASGFELLVFVPIAFLGAQHSRMLFVFGIVAAPLVARMVADYRGPRRAKQGHLPTHACFLLMIALVCAARFPQPAAIQANIDAANPVQAIRYIRENRLSGPMLNDYAWGGYLIWALPEYRTFIDPRADLFDWAGVFAQYRHWTALREDPVQLLDQYRIGFCLLPAHSPSSRVMRHLPGWRQAYADDIAVVFVRQTERSPAS